MAEAWLNRARGHAALGLRDAARDHAEHVRAVAPGSPMAAEAETFLRSLAGGG